MKYLVIFLILVVVLGGGGYLVYAKMKNASASPTVVQITEKVSRRTIEKIVSANGKVASNRDVDIKCQASGTIKNLPYKDVSKEVKPGEMLCQLDPIDMQRQLDTQKAVVDADQSRISEAMLNRDIAKMNLVTTRQRVESTLASAQAQAADAHAKAQRTRQLYEAKPTALASKEELDTAETSATQADASVTNAKVALAELVSRNSRSTPRNCRSSRCRPRSPRTSRASTPPNRTSIIAPYSPPRPTTPTIPRAGSFPPS
jgi:multidrug efflux pump subunit AcrA (membrane-fusion protein)